MSKKYHYFYKITNTFNNHFYYGIHSTNNLDDGYMGSGTRLNYYYKKYGTELFQKEIIDFFPTREQASEYEAKMVTEELVKKSSCYNCALGGDNAFMDRVVVYNKEQNKWIQITLNEYNKNKDKYITATTNKVTVKNDDGIGYKTISKEEFYKNKEKYQTPTANKIIVKNKKGKYFSVDKDDPRYLTGELTAIWKDRKHSEESKQKMRETSKKIKHQQGEKNSQYGTCWVYKPETSENLKIKKEKLQEYLDNGYIKGRKLPNMIPANKKKVLQYDLNMTLIKEWDSLTDAEIFYDIKNQLSACCHGKRKTAKGFIWRYKDNN